MSLIIDSPRHASFLDPHKRSRGDAVYSGTPSHSCTPHIKKSGLTRTRVLGSRGCYQCVQVQCDLPSLVDTSPRSAWTRSTVLKSFAQGHQCPHHQLVPVFQCTTSQTLPKVEISNTTSATIEETHDRPVFLQHSALTADRSVSQATSAACLSRVKLAEEPVTHRNNVNNPDAAVSVSLAQNIKKSYAPLLSRQYITSHEMPASSSILRAPQPSVTPSGRILPTKEMSSNTPPTKATPCVYANDQLDHHVNHSEALTTLINPTALTAQGNDTSRLRYGLPMLKLHNTAVWKGSMLGRGYSGAVHRGLRIVLSESQDRVCASEPMAVKISDNKTIEFAKHNSLANCMREFEVLKLLYAEGVPVPKPINFSMHTDAEGNGQTVLSMELIEGQTLRDWINAQTAHVVRHRGTGRTLHPAMSVKSALDRIDVALSLVDALHKLHPLGVFVDLKPRNIMVTRCAAYGLRTKNDTLYYGCTSVGRLHHAHQWNVTLVDMGGVVLRRDVQSRVPDPACLDQVKPGTKPSRVKNPSTFHNDNVAGRNTPPALSPFKVARSVSDVPIVSTQSLSTAPSLAARVPVCNDYPCIRTPTISSTTRHSFSSDSQSRKRVTDTSTIGDVQDDTNEPVALAEDMRIHPILHRHFLETTCSYVSPEVSAAIVESDRLKNRLAHHFQPCLKEHVAYSDRDPKERELVAPQYLEKAYQELVAQLHLQKILYRERLEDKPHEKGEASYVRLGEKSSVFSLGLILVELFGGLRTGLTGLCHFPVISEWFSGSAPREHQPLHSAVRIPSQTAVLPADREFRIALEWNIRQLPIVVSASPLHSDYFDLPTVQRMVASSGACMNASDTADGALRIGCVSSSSRVVWMSSFHDVYKQYCYPKEGLLASARRDRRKMADCFDGRDSFFAGPACPLSKKYEALMSSCGVSSGSEMQEQTLKNSGLRSSNHQPRFHKGSPCATSSCGDVASRFAGDLVEYILDGCLETSPTRRPTYTVLRRALLMLRDVVLCMHQHQP